MISSDRRALFTLTSVDAAERIEREPFAIEHDLSGLEIFSIGYLEALARRYRSEDYFVASGAPAADTAFYSVARDKYTPYEAIAALDVTQQRVLLKRPENYDPVFRELLDAIFAQIATERGARTDRLVRLQGSILVSSAATITPFHFDPEVSFFFQIDGPKTYHLYSPAVLRPSELEAFYRRGAIDIAQVDLAGRDPALEYVFELGPGKGMHQPRSSPHWVQTHGSTSISFVVSYETDSMRAVDRIHAFNYYLRKAGGRPAAIGARPALDDLKLRSVSVAAQVRRTASKIVRRPRGSSD